MDPEKQKQIIGYFIEEAKEHLNTIETGLLNLEETLADQEMVNDLFRAAHSIKGGAAMLGFSSIQHLSHSMEDYFKILKENTNITIDENLKTLFLNGFDRLQELLDQLQSPFGLTQDATDEVMANATPIFDTLKNHLHNLVNGKVAEPTPAIASRAAAPAAAAAKPTGETRAMALMFQNDIPVKLRDMLEQFKQPDRPTSRQKLKEICGQLYRMGEQFELTKWCEVINAVQAVIGNPNNPYRTLAPLVIKEIKQAQEMVLAQKPQAIAISAQLKALMPPVVVETEDESSSIFSVIEAENKVTKSWQTFGDRIGWRTKGSWIRTAEVKFDGTAPEGHLPAPLWLASWDKSKDSAAEEFRKQYEAFIAKITECER